MQCDVVVYGYQSIYIYGYQSVYIYLGIDQAFMLAGWLPTASISSDHQHK
jgi:hypothetical protein